jgi:hypothetical protein
MKNENKDIPLTGRNRGARRARHVRRAPAGTLSTLNLNFCTPNTKHQNPNSKIQNPKTQDSKPEIQNPKITKTKTQAQTPDYKSLKL